MQVTIGPDRARARPRYVDHSEVEREGPEGRGWRQVPARIRTPELSDLAGRRRMADCALPGFSLDSEAEDG
jgi:hypothetical protein